MPLDRLLLELPAGLSPAIRRNSTTESPRPVEQRLALVEGELRIQFTRIAQLQAQLDRLLGVLRRSPDGGIAGLVAAARIGQQSVPSGSVFRRTTDERS